MSPKITVNKTKQNPPPKKQAKHFDEGNLKKSLNDLPLPKQFVSDNTEKELPKYSAEEVDNIIKEYKADNIDTNTVLSADSLSEIFKNNDGGGVYEIYFPYCDKSYKFKQLNVAQQRTISKSSADFDNKAEQIKIRIGLLKAICLDSDFNPMEITYPEFTAAILKVRTENFIENLLFNIKCVDGVKPDGTACTATFQHDVDPIAVYDRALSLIKIIKDKDKVYKFTQNGVPVEFKIDYPSLSKYLELLKYTSENKGTEEGEDIANYVYSHIKEIKVQGRKVNISKFNLQQFKKWIDNTFLDLKFNKLVDYLDEVFKEYNTDFYTFETQCPVCKKKRIITLSDADFFED